MINVTAGIIPKEGKYLIAQRKGGYLDKKWEFPGGKIDPGETPEGCLERELWEEGGIKVRVGNFFGESVHVYSFGTIRLLAYHVEYVSGIFRLKVHYDVEWVFPSEMLAYDFAEADIPLVERLVDT